jgi:hypothetical protein
MSVVEGPEEAAWGYHFDFQSRVFFYPRSAPNTIATSFVIHGLVDAWEATGADRWLRVARRGVAFLLRRMLVEGGRQSAYFRYVVGHDDLIHNASALAASAVLRVCDAAGEPAPPAAAQALELLLRSQRHDGSWPYGERAGLEWVDSYHTGYVLEGLEYARRAGADCEEALARGIEFYDRELFRPDGLTPRFTTERELPLDTHCIAQAIDTHAAVAGWRPDSLDRAVEIARHAVETARKPDGSFIFERRRLWTNKIAFIRWTNGPMFRALGSLLRALSRVGG